VCLQAGKYWIADHRMQSGRLESLKRSAASEPGDAEAWDRLGRFEQYDFADPDPAQAVAHFREAVRHNPHSANYWLDLAGAYETTGDIARARDAFEQARAAYPVSAEVAWSFGNFLLRQEQFSEGYAQVQQAVRSDPSLLPIAVSRIWRSNRDVEQLLDHVLPPDQDAYFQALDFFASAQETEPALRVWERLRALQEPIVLARSFPLIDALMQADRSDDARRVWREALESAGEPYVEPADGSLIYNGSFGHDFYNGGFDWRWPAPPIGVSIGFDAAPPSHGVRSLRLDFGGGSNIELREPTQYVPVEPGHGYHFRAFVRTEHITTESGVRFSISGTHETGDVKISTDNLTGTNPWTAVDAGIRTGPATHFLAVRMFRNGSRLFDNKLSGTVWIADVSLTPAESDSGQKP
jgi:hypothetical protein